MNSTQESASKWLGKSLAEAKIAYLSASAMTLLSACCFVVFSWYLSSFAATWLDHGLVQPTKLLYAAAFITGRYIFAQFASQINYNAANIIVGKIKKSFILNYSTTISPTPYRAHY